MPIHQFLIIFIKIEKNTLFSFYLNDGIGYADTGQNIANVWFEFRSIHERFMSFDCKTGAFAPIGSSFPWMIWIEDGKEQFSKI